MVRYGVFAGLASMLLAVGCSSSTPPPPAADGSVTGGSRDGGSTDGGTVDGGTKDGGSPDGGTPDGGTVDAGSPDGGTPDGGALGASVLMHHNDLARDGVYVAPALTRAAAAGIHVDTSFGATVTGNVYAQPLYLAAATPGGKDLVIVVTEADIAYGLDAANGSVVWSKKLGTPAPKVKPYCGNINPLGITGTPVIDPATRTLYLDAMVVDGSGNRHHKVYALNADTGAVKIGWPVDVGTAVSGFNAPYQNERGALALVGGIVYVPYGGHYGDCGNYRGWLVGIHATDPTKVKGWSTSARGGGSWAVGGVASDGSHLYIATGNTFNVSTWSGGEAIIRFTAGPSFSGATTDYFAPSDWTTLDSGDVDIGGSGPVLFDVKGATPSHLVVALGKNGKAYLMNRNALGGVGGQLAVKKVSTSEIIQAATAYTTSQGTYVAFFGNGSGCPQGQSGNLTALKIGATSPPTISVAWCAGAGGHGSPIFTTTGGGANPLVWIVGAQGDNRLHAFDADTGAVVFGGGGSGDVMTTVQHMQAPIVAKGRIFVAADGKVYAFTP